MSKTAKGYVERLKFKKRTGIGSGMPLNKQKRRRWKPNVGQGRP